GLVGAAQSRTLTLNNTQVNGVGNVVIGSETGTHSTANRLVLTNNSGLTGVDDLRLGFWRVNTNATGFGSGLLSMNSGAVSANDIVVGGYYGAGANDAVSWNNPLNVANGDGGDGY